MIIGRMSANELSEARDEEEKKCINTNDTIVK